MASTSTNKSSDQSSDQSGGWILVTRKKRSSKPKTTPSTSNYTQDNSSYNTITELQHQDLRPIVFRKPDLQKTSTPIKPISDVRKHTGNHKVGTSVEVDASRIRKLEKQADEGNFHIDKVSDKVKTQIMKARQEKGWTQAELAKRCNFPVAIIRDYEAGNAIYKGSEISVIARTLGVKITK